MDMTPSAAAGGYRRWRTLLEAGLVQGQALGRIDEGGDALAQPGQLGGRQRSL
jgi:hypothetical protein